MKKTTFAAALVLLIALAASCTQTKKEGYIINGTILADVNIDSMAMYYSTGEKMASVPVADNKFTFTGTLKEPRLVTIGNEEAYFSFDLILENDNYNITIGEGGETMIEGGAIHPVVLGYMQTEEYIRLKQNYNQVMNDAFADVDMDNEEQVTRAREALTPHEEALWNYTRGQSGKIIEGDYPTLTKAYALIMNQDWETYPPEKTFALIDQYQKEVGTLTDLELFSENLRMGREMEENQQKVSNGAPFQNIIGKDRDGKTVNLADVVAANNYTILEFWASWCGPCRAEIPNLKKAYEKYKAKGLEIVSVSLDSDHASWITAMDEEKPTWINISVENNFKNPQVAAYGVMGIPASYLISKEGVIVANNSELREFELERTLQKIIP